MDHHNTDDGPAETDEGWHGHLSTAVPGEPIPGRIGIVPEPQRPAILEGLRGDDLDVIAERAFDRAWSACESAWQEHMEKLGDAWQRESRDRARHAYREGHHAGEHLALGKLEANSEGNLQHVERQTKLILELLPKNIGKARREQIESRMREFVVGYVENFLKELRSMRRDDQDKEDPLAYLL